VSGPLRTDDIPPVPEPSDEVSRPVLQLEASRTSTVGHLQVRRALPRRGRRTLGAWCFVDHMGPARTDGGVDTGIGPHPHIGLQTVTWLVAGELRHLDSLGSDQVIRPGQLNLMTAGAGVAHAEEGTGRPVELHGVQLWVAQPDATRHGAPAFEHHAELPRVELEQGVATILVGHLLGASSPARRDTDHIGVDLDLRAGRSVVPLDRRAEHGLVVVEGVVTIEGTPVEPGHLAYLGEGRDELALDAPGPARALLLGGLPFESPVLMWWNFVGRARDEVEEAADAWNRSDARFGTVASSLARIPAPPPPWR